MRPSAALGSPYGTESGQNPERSAASELRVHVERFDDLADDLERLLGWARECSGSLPLFLMGHSMGGLAAFALPALVAAECAVLGRS